MKISYAILTHNEGEYIQNLIPFLLKYKQSEDEVVVVDDFSDDPLTKEILNKYKDQIILEYREFDGDHTQKNYLNSLCTGDYIVQLDADELITEELIGILPGFLKDNSNIDLFIVPRINTVLNLTKEWIDRWGWKVNEKGWVNYPDWQMRIYRNCDWVKWEGLLHSKIIGYKAYAHLPMDEIYSIIHCKQLDRQIEQNELYNKIEQNGKTKYKI